MGAIPPYQTERNGSNFSAVYLGRRWKAYSLKEKKMREIKFRVWDKKANQMVCWKDISRTNSLGIFVNNHNRNDSRGILSQYTGLKDKNGVGLTEVYEGDIIDENGNIKGNIYEMDAREADIIIPQLGTKAWNSAYKEAVVRGFDYSE